MKVAVYKNALPVEVYKTAIETFKTHIAVPGVVGKSLDKAKLDDARKADVRYLRPERKDTALMNKVSVIRHHVDNEGSSSTVNDYASSVGMYNWLIDFMSENKYGNNLEPEVVQVITYKEGNYYDWHRDGSGTGYRKFSFISILSPKDQYEGGELEIDGIELPEYAYDPLSVIIFNPSLRHRVKPVTKGIRHSLVTWFKDKDFPRELMQSNLPKGGNKKYYD